MSEPRRERDSTGGRYSDDEVAAREERNRLTGIAQLLDLRQRTVATRNKWAAEGRGTAALQRMIDRCDDGLRASGYEVGEDG